MEKVNFKIRASACSEIMAVTIGLTDVQQSKYDELTERKKLGVKPLTANMEAELNILQDKLNNPELPTGAKTYCKQWLKEYLYKRRQDIQSKYLTKGNHTEEAGFTLMAIELKLGMVFKNEQYRENATMTGTWDLLTNDTVLDNKSCWSLDTFPMFDNINPKKEYEWQMQVYMELSGVEKATLAYTLNNAPELLIQQQIRWIEDHNERIKVLNNMIFTTDYFEAMRVKYANEASLNFVEIPQSKRIKTFNFTKDNTAIYRINERVKMCNNFVNSINI